MTEVVIDISGADSEDLEPAAARPSRRRHLLAVVLAIVTLLSVSASRAQERPALTRLLTIDGNGEALLAVEGDLILHSGRDGLTATDFDGRVRWSLPGMSGIIHARTWRDRLILTTSVGMAAQTAVVDPATGSVHWRANGFAELVGDLLVVRVMSASRDQTGGTVEIRRAGNYEPVWSLPRRQAFTVDARLGRVLALDASGVLTGHDLGTGRVVVSAQLPPSDQPWQTVFAVDEQTLQVSSYGQGTEKVLRVDSETLQVRTSPVRPRDQFACGPVTCVRDGDIATSIVDTKTGQQLWRTENQRVFPAYEGLIFVDSGNVTWLADYLTGQRVALGAWQPMVGPVNGSSPQLMRRDNYQAGKTDVGVLQGGKVHWLGMVPVMLQRCRPAANVLICVLPNEKTAVWRIVLADVRNFR